LGSHYSGYGGSGGSGGIGQTGTNGSAGGAGGNGGTPLALASSLNLMQSSNSVITLDAGKGGNGGQGGQGGNGGKGGDGGIGGDAGGTCWMCNKPSGYAGNGPSGSGRNGGNAGNGGVGGVGGANGTLFNIGGSNSRLENSIGGLGGAAGTVGARGLAGTAKSGTWGTNGSNGVAGNLGTDRSSTRASSGASTHLTTTRGTPTTTNNAIWNSSRIVIDSIGTLEYHPNELFDIAGVRMRLIIGSTVRTLTPSDVGVFYDFKTPGETLVTITVDTTTGKVIRYIPVRVLHPSIERVKLVEPQTTFYRGDSFTSSGLGLDVYFNNGDMITLRSGINANPPANVTGSSGRKTVPVTIPTTVTHMGRSHSLSSYNTQRYTVDVHEIGLDWLEITKDPNNTEFFEGETFDPTGMEFRAHYNNGSSYPLTWENVRFSPPVGSTLERVESAYQIVVSYGHSTIRTVQFSVTVKADPIVSLVIRRNPNKTTYFENDVFDPAGMVVDARRQSGRRLENLSLGNLDWSRGPLYELDKDIEIIYRTASGFFSAPVSITVSPIAQTGIEIVNMPDKQNYIEGQTFDPVGMIVDRVFNNGNRDAGVAGYTLSHSVLSISDSAVTVRNNGFEAFVPVFVSERMVLELECVQMPTKTMYEEGETFSPDGMVVKATYDNESVDNNIAGYEITPDRPLIVGDTEVFVTFGGVSLDIPITVSEVKPTGVTLNRTTMTLLVGNSGFLSETVLPDDAANKTVTWISNTPDIASVDEFGIVTALKAGTAIITATTAEGGFAASCTVTVVSDGAAILSVSSVAALPGKTITVDIDIANNPGFAGMALKVSYPQELTLTRYMPGNMDVLAGFTGPDGVSPGATCSISDHFFMVWGRTANYSEDGTLVTLTFSIDQDAEQGEYPIIVTFEQHNGPRTPVNLQGQPLSIYISDGYAIALSHILGSVTDSGYIAPADLVRLARWIAGHKVTINELAANVTGSGDIGPADLVRLARWIAGHFGKLTIEQVQIWQREHSHLTLEQAIVLFYPPSDGSVNEEEQ
jgi:hypothetical protein